MYCPGWSRALAAGLVLGTVLVCRDAGSAEDAPPPLIRYGNDALTVRVSGMSNSEVLDELARQTGAEIRGEVCDSREVTADFDAVPLPEALARVLGEQNFALVYGKGGSLKAIQLLGGNESAVRTPASAVTAAAVSTEPPFPGVLPQLIDRHPPVPISGLLADALGARTATLRQLIDVGLHHENADVRAEAVRTGIATFEAEAELRSAMISELQKVDSVPLSNLLRAFAPDQAEDVAAQVLREAQTPEIRVKASAVVQRLRLGS